MAKIPSIAPTATILSPKNGTRPEKASSVVSKPETPITTAANKKHSKEATTVATTITFFKETLEFVSLIKLVTSGIASHPIKAKKITPKGRNKLEASNKAKFSSFTAGAAKNAMTPIAAKIPIFKRNSALAISWRPFATKRVPTATNNKVYAVLERGRKEEREILRKFPAKIKYASTVPTSTNTSTKEANNLPHIPT